MQQATIYTARFCPYCKAAKALLVDAGIPFEEIDISGNWEARDHMIAKSNGETHLPQLFSGDRHIGGYKELKTLGDRDAVRRAFEPE